MRLFVYSFYISLWCCSNVLNYIIHVYKLLGNYNKNRNTVRTGRILWRKKFSIMSITSSMDFICAFTTHVEPEYVLKPNISLYAVTEKEAIFVETPQDVNLFHSDTHPFAFVSQFLNATKIIRMSVGDFVKLAEKLGDPTVSVVWIANTGRCGGTMLAQLFETIPGTLVIHEPDPPTNLYHLYEYNLLPMSEYHTLLQSTLRIMCKSRKGITRICIKPRPICNLMMTDISKQCLDIKQLFLYRNCLDTLKSWLGIFGYDPYIFVIRSCTDAVWFSNICPYMKNLLAYHFVSKLKNAKELPKDPTTACIIVYNWGNQIHIAYDAMSRDQHILPVKYEDIIAKPNEIVGKIFNDLGIDISYVANALKTLARDSQRGSTVSRERVGDDSNRFISTMETTKSNDILRAHDLPPLGEDFRI